MLNLSDLFKNVLFSSQNRDKNQKSLSFKDLYSQKGLIKLDHIFCCYLKEQDRYLFSCYEIARQNPETSKSELLLKVAVYVENFLSHLFSIEKELKSTQEHHNRLAPLYTVKRQFVQRYALSQYPEAEPITFDFEDELTFAQKVIFWSTDEEQYKQELDKAARYAAWATLTKEGQKKHEDGILFKRPKKIDPSQLIDISSIKPRDRQGFNLTDPGFDLKKALDQVHYCIKCHPQNKDFCSKGYPTHSKFRHDAFGHLLTGCPLEQKISEMNELKEQGHIIGALAIICIDNPMVAATGYRICNECMKACIFQKQEPVHIPGIETQILVNVLSLPYGFEIYSLLTRWNPLSLKNPLPKEPTGKTVLVIGMGPSGFTLSHYLLREGHGVVGIDGLKIEPLDKSLKNLVPIKDYETLKEDLSTRLIGGFGGVAEYGITVRWDKNFLKVIRLLLERQTLFRLYGGVRFGGTFGLQQAFEEIGFSHVALCMGTGRPTILDLEMAKGIRQASDFLMALQLTGAFKKDSLTNLQIRLPIVVIGGGLTAIDAATEALAYYPFQVEKFLGRYETLVKEHVEATWNEEEKSIACEFLSHGRALRSTSYKKELLQSWGGSTIVYRKPFNQSPSYTLNHEEVIKALEEGISIVDSSTPKKIKIDNLGWVKSLIVDHKGEEKEIPCKTILVAAGTKPNVSLDEKEEFLLNEGYFQAIDEDGKLVSLEKNSKPKQTHVLIKKYRSGHALSFFGDLHPSFQGNVVKAMASAKRGYPILTNVMEKISPSKTPLEIFAYLEKELLAYVHEIKRLGPNIIELMIKAPMVSRAFRPGQFYRLQNYESSLPIMEGLALTGSYVDKHQGLISTIVLETGGSTSLCQFLKPNDPIVLMGPTGTPTEIPFKKKVLLIGGGVGNAVLFSIGQALRQNSCFVIYFAGYKNLCDQFKKEEIEKASHIVVWCTDEPSSFIPTRPQDRYFIGNVVQALETHQDLLKNIDRMLVTGSDRMMAAVSAFYKNNPLFRQTTALASINSPMQCMMKGICGQCLQQHKAPSTIVYSCLNQDQSLGRVDFDFLTSRLQQNNVQEKLTKLWLKHIKKITT